MKEMYVSHIVNNYFQPINQLKDIPKFTYVISSTNKIRCVVTFVSIHYPVTLLVSLKQLFITNGV